MHITFSLGNPIGRGELGGGGGKPPKPPRSAPATSLVIFFSILIYWSSYIICWSFRITRFQRIHTFHNEKLLHVSVLARSQHGCILYFHIRDEIKRVVHRALSHHQLSWSQFKGRMSRGNISTRVRAWCWRPIRPGYPQAERSCFCTYQPRGVWQVRGFEYLCRDGMIKDYTRRYCTGTK